jgi:NO-binding membrane sensor protein with MHYT domain
MGGTWSMRCIAMMAVDFPTLVSDLLIETIASICSVIIAAGAGLYRTNIQV